MSAPLGKKLKAVKWGKFKVTDLFIIKNTRSILASAIKENSGSIPYLCASADNNSVSSYISYNTNLLEEGNCIFIGGKTFVVSYQENDFFSNDSHNLVLYLKNSAHRTKNIQKFIASCIKSGIGYKYTWGNSISHTKMSKESLSLPVNVSGAIDYTFMETFIRELEEERIRELAAYLTASGLTDYHLPPPEIDIIYQFDKTVWGTFNLEKLYGKSTRGKRLKSADRVPGKLIFVTAGEANEGISAHIGNHVEIFPKNTTSIDMFGSAKYRNYEYGADDHVAVVHTENLPKYASIFVTSAIHKAAHTGKFSYAKNFYAKDADELNISLPIKDGIPDYTFMATFIRAVQKLVIKNVVRYTDKKISAYKQVSTQ